MGGGENKAKMKKKVGSPAFSSAVSCCQVKMYFLLSLQTLAESLGMVNLPDTAFPGDAG